MTVARPRTILILIATERVSGPLKGILQCIEYLDGRRYRPLVGLLRTKPDRPSDAELEVRSRQIPCIVLSQSSSFDWRVVPKARRVVREQDVSIVQTHGYKTHVLGFILQRFAGLPWIGFEHGWTAENWRIRLYHRVDWILRFADRVVAVSDEQRNHLRRLGVPGRKVERIHNAVDPDAGWLGCMPGGFRLEHGVPLDVPLIAVIGRISPEKGQADFLDAFRLVASASPGAHAVLAGEGVDAARVSQKVKDLRLEQVVHLVGHQRTVGPIYCDADVIAIPSGSEGIPNVLLEAMVAGRPVVTTGVGGVTEVVTNEKHALVVPPGQPGPMAAAILRLVQEKPLRDQLVERALQRIRSDYSPAQRADRISRIYDKLGT